MGVFIDKKKCHFTCVGNFAGQSYDTSNLRNKDLRFRFELRNNLVPHSDVFVRDIPRLVLGFAIVFVLVVLDVLVLDVYRVSVRVLERTGFRIY